MDCVDDRLVKIALKWPIARGGLRSILDPIDERGGDCLVLAALRDGGGAVIRIGHLYCRGVKKNWYIYNG